MTAFPRANYLVLRMKLLKKWWVRALLIATTILLFAYLASWIFKFNLQVCDSSDAKGQQICRSDNTVSVLLWGVYRFFDAGSGTITAIATFAIAYLTKTLATVSQNQKTILETQAEISKQQMLVEHKPVIKVRHVALVDERGNQISKLPGIGERIRGGLAVVNMGALRQR